MLQCNMCCVESNCFWCSTCIWSNYIGRTNTIFKKNGHGYSSKVFLNLQFIFPFVLLSWYTVYRKVLIEQVCCCCMIENKLSIENVCAKQIELLTTTYINLVYLKIWDNIVHITVSGINVTQYIYRNKNCSILENKIYIQIEKLAKCVNFTLVFHVVFSSFLNNDEEYSTLLSRIIILIVIGNRVCMYPLQ